MGSVLRRVGTPLAAGFAIWLLSFPLITTHPAQPAMPTIAAALAPGPATDDRPNPSRHARPRTLIVGQLAAPPQPAAPAELAAPASPRPAAAANWIRIARLGLSQPVGWYSDCMGRAPVPRWGAWRERCAGANNTYIMAHNPGVFAPILALHAGDIVTYRDPSGVVHTYRITFTTIVSNTELWPLAALPTASITLQTCWTWDGSRDFIARGVQL